MFYCDKAQVRGVRCTGGNIQPRALKCTDAPRSRISVDIERARFVGVYAPTRHVLLRKHSILKNAVHQPSRYFIKRFSILNGKTRIFTFDREEMLC